MSNIKYDLPLSFFGPGTLLDANLSFAEQDINVPGGRIFIEKYAALKSQYTALEKGTKSSFHPNAYLLTTTNFSDIGGGVITFERHFVVIPPSRTTYVTTAINILAVNLSGVGIRRYLNATSVDEINLPSNPLRVGRISLESNCRVTHRYGFEEDLSELALASLPITRLMGGSIPEGMIVAQDAPEPWVDPVFVLRTYRTAQATPFFRTVT